MNTNIEIVQNYFNAVSQGDFETVGKLFADDIIWHQPGSGIQSGVYKGKENVFAHLGNFMKWSNGTFAIDAVDYTTSNDNLVVASIHFKAEKDGSKMAMKGVDLLKVDNEKITEVWLFSENIEEEDAFWNTSAK